MSNQINDTIIERGYELLEEINSHPSGYDKQLAKALESNDLEEVSRLVASVEAELSRENFYNYNLGV